MCCCFRGERPLTLRIFTTHFAVWLSGNFNGFRGVATPVITSGCRSRRQSDCHTISSVVLMMMMTGRQLCLSSFCVFVENVWCIVSAIFASSVFLYKLSENVFSKFLNWFLYVKIKFFNVNFAIVNHKKSKNCL